jgi:hypothetical protein
MSKEWIEYITLGIALVALTQPWLIHLYKKLFDKPVLECYANKSATITFDSFGVGLYCTLTMISNKCDNVITSIEINVFKGISKDTKIYSMIWELLSSIYRRRTYSEWGGSSRDTTSFTPCPMYLTKGNPISYGIHFGDEKLTKDFNGTIQSGKGNDYIRDTLLTNFNFHAEKHRIEIIFTDH